ncbi:hypothetical protein [Pseudomonas boanensis]|uniref:hypothetical protein n=1 Tax=Metapseudomonas boanensis TaxID=2822138 RepID=UPI0035D47003
MKHVLLPAISIRLQACCGTLPAEPAAQGNALTLDALPLRARIRHQAPLPLDFRERYAPGLA